MIVVTGANGYVASSVVSQLVKSTQEPVMALVRSEKHFAKARSLGATPVNGDVTDPQSLDAAFKGARQVIHLAAVNRDHGKSTMQAVNAQGTINVADAAKRAGISQVVAVVGLGAGANMPYTLARTQGVGVDYLMRSGVPYTVLEASVIFGPGDEFINTLAGLARIPPFMVVPGNGKAKFQPISNQDVTTCVIRSLDNADVMNKRLQICGSEVLTLESIIDTILAELKIKRLKLHMPVPILKIAINLMDKLLPKAPVTPSLLEQLGVDNVATDNATDTVFHIKPARLADGIAYVHEMTLKTLVQRSLGKANYR